MPCSAEIEPPAAVTRSWTKGDRGSPALEPRLGAAPAGAADVEMDVAVAEMAEGDHRVPGEARLHRRAASVMKAGMAGDRHRDIVLGRRPVLPLRLGDRIAQPPEGLRLRLARGDRRVVASPSRARRQSAS
jgi:hypothetical protein